MPSLYLLILAFACFSRSMAQDMPCQGALNCLKGVTDNLNDGTIANLCQELEKSMTCVDAEVTKCVENGDIPQEAADHQKSILSQQMESMKQRCAAAAASGAGDINLANIGGEAGKCSDNAMACMKDYMATMGSISDEPGKIPDMSAVCDKVEEASICLNKVMEECSKSGVMSAEQVGVMKAQMESSLTTVKDQCENRDGKQAYAFCSEIQECMFDMKEFEAAGKNMDVAKMCMTFNKAETCTAQKVDACIQDGKITQEAAKAIMAELAQEDLKKICSGFSEGRAEGAEGAKGAEGAEGAKSAEGAKTEQVVLKYENNSTDPECYQISECLGRMSEVTMFLQEGNTEEACKILKPMVECTEHSIKDCDATEKLDVNRSREEAIAKAKTLLEKQCSTGGAVTAVGGWMTLAVSLVVCFVLGREFTA